jgi:hypothetical protein
MFLLLGCLADARTGGILKPACWAKYRSSWCDSFVEEMTWNLVQRVAFILRARKASTEGSIPGHHHDSSTEKYFFGKKASGVLNACTRVTAGSPDRASQRVKSQHGHPGKIP